MTKISDLTLLGVIKRTFIPFATVRFFVCPLRLLNSFWARVAQSENVPAVACTGLQVQKFLA